jgi:hypothetical protein
MHSAELETLDQLLGGDLRLEAISKLFFQRGIRAGCVGTLVLGDVVLLTVDGDEVKQWRGRKLFSTDLHQREDLILRITPQGARRIG